MRYRSLGTTGVKVSPLCLGAMMFGAIGNPDHDDCVRIIHRALDAGINFVDTADVYSAGESETIVGKALAGRRDDVVLATKFHGPMGQDPNRPDPNRQGNSRRWIVQEVEDSLRRLGTDHIDLYQVHRPGLRDRHRRHAVRAVATWSARARCSTSARRRSRQRPSWRRSGWPSSAVTSGSGSSSRRTRSSCAASRPRCCRRVSATAWA